ncbi:hypothetical protein NKG05_19715 [Oerskovia sp. M15]
MSMPAVQEERPPRSLVHRVVDRARMVYIFGSPVRATFVKATDRSVTVYTTHLGKPTVSKYFARTRIGRDAFGAERTTGTFSETGRGACRSWRGTAAGSRSRACPTTRASTSPPADVARASRRAGRLDPRRPARDLPHGQPAR